MISSRIIVTRPAKTEHVGTQIFSILSNIHIAHNYHAVKTYCVTGYSLCPLAGPVTIIACTIHRPLCHYVIIITMFLPL